MRRRCWKRSLGAAVVVLLLGAPAASAQNEAPPDQQQAGPTPPDLVLSGRDVRLTRAGYGHVTIGCRQTSTPGEACLGTLTLRLAETLTIDARRPGSTRTVRRKIPMGNIGTANFQTPVGVGQRLTIRFPALIQQAVRQVGAVSVQLIGTYVSRAGQGGTVKRYVTLYFPKSPPT